jgi:hypothetical protein
LWHSLKVDGRENHINVQKSGKPAAKIEHYSSTPSTEPSDARPEQVACNDATLNSACFVCGEENQHGLHLAFQTDGGRASSVWTPRIGWESFQGVIHGGVISSVLDEAMSKALILHGYEAFTVDLRIRFRKTVCVGDVVSVSGWVLCVEKRKILAEATITSEEGDEKAHAWGVFLVARK